MAWLCECIVLVVCGINVVSCVEVIEFCDVVNAGIEGAEAVIAVLEPGDVPGEAH